MSQASSCKDGTPIVVLKPESETEPLISRVMTVLAGAPVGGAETFFVTLSGALAQNGHTVCSVLKPNRLRQTALEEAGIGYATAPFTSPFDWTTPRVLRRAAEKFRPEIVLAFAGRAAKAVPEGPYKIIGRLGGYYNLTNFRRCHHLVCNSPDVLRHILAQGWPESRASLIPNFASVPAVPPAKRSDFDTPDSAPLALALGRLHPNKGLDILIRAAARIPQLYVWIAGEGGERRKLENLADGLKIGDRLKFLGWRSDCGALYGAADICVYPSRKEPFGNIVVEAWSSGIPLVTTCTPGPAWLARDREDALLVPTDDVIALAQAIGELLESPALRERLTSAGKRRIAAEFSRAAVISRFAELFRKLTN
jgi:glycosyltransferase involved in cell wall biosynthesis